MISEKYYVYIKSTRQSFVILSIYINDILSAENDMEFLITFKKWLSYHLEMNYMKYDNYVLGVKIPQDQ